MGRGYTLYNIYRGGVLDVSFQWSVFSGQLSEISEVSKWLASEKGRKASQARNIINANFANYTNCLVLSGRVGRMNLSGKVGKMRVFFV